MSIILFSLGVTAITATVLPLLPNNNWWIRGFDFPRLQISLLIIAVLFAYLILFDDLSASEKTLSIFLFISLIYQTYMIYPYTRFGAFQVEQTKNPSDEVTISLLCTNVQMENRNSAKLKEVIRKKNPDIILGLETDDWWLDQLSEFEEDYPHTIKQPQDNMYGMALYSRMELIDPEVKFLVEDDIPSLHLKTTLPCGQEIKLHCLHPRPPWPSGSDTSTERDAELLIVGKAIKNSTEPTIVFGDMNDVAWSDTNYLFQDISGLLDPRAGRGFYNSFHAKYPFVRFPLDHFFHSNHFRLVSFERLENVGSDHFPMFITLCFERDASFEQEEMEADADEEKVANEKIKEGMQ